MFEHPDPRFYQKCAAYNSRHCYECYPASGPAPTQTVGSVEDALVGRTSVPVAPASSTPSPVSVSLTEPRSAPSQVQQSVQEAESPTMALVHASHDYAKAVAAMEKAVRLVADLEKRLEFAKEDARETITARDKALEVVRQLVGEKP